MCGVLQYYVNKLTHFVELKFYLLGTAPAHYRSHSRNKNWIFHYFLNVCKCSSWLRTLKENPVAKHFLYKNILQAVLLALSTVVLHVCFKEQIINAPCTALSISFRDLLKRDCIYSAEDGWSYHVSHSCIKNRVFIKKWSYS